MVFFANYIQKEGELYTKRKVEYVCGEVYSVYTNFFCRYIDSHHA